MVCAGGGGGRWSPLKEGGGGWERGSHDRPIAEPLFRVPFHPILEPRDGSCYELCPHVGPREGRGYAPTAQISTTSFLCAMGCGRK